MGEATVERAEFEAAAGRHRRELHVHCYRMLGSLEDAEDAVQETFLRAWRRRETYAGRASLRAWLYKIATNACLDALEKRPRQPTPVEVVGTGEMATEVLWIEPYPDRLLEPEAVTVARETIELAFMVALQHLTPQARAVLILRDVLGWSAKESAALLETTPQAVNSALQRARAGLQQHLPAERADWSAADGAGADDPLLRRYMQATEEADVEGLRALFHDDLRFSMPPQTGTYHGRDTVVDGWVEGGFGSPEIGKFVCTLTFANRQPAVVNYVLKPGAERPELFAIDVLSIDHGLIREVVAFSGKAMDAFGLPRTL